MSSALTFWRVQHTPGSVVQTQSGHDRLEEENYQCCGSGQVQEIERCLEACPLVLYTHTGLVSWSCEHTRFGVFSAHSGVLCTLEKDTPTEECPAHLMTRTVMDEVKNTRPRDQHTRRVFRTL